MLAQILVLLQVEILLKELLAFLLVLVLEMLILEKIIVFLQVERLVFLLEDLIMFWPALMEKGFLLFMALAPGSESGLNILKNVCKNINL